MSSKNGTNVASAVTTFTTEDKYATAYADEIQGGLHIVESVTERNAIPPARRKVGMHCQIFDSVLQTAGKEYILINDSGQEATTDTDWAETTVNAAGISMTDKPKTSVEDRIVAAEAALSIKHYGFIIKESDIAVGPVNLELSPMAKSQITDIQLLVPIDTASTADISAQIERYNGMVWSIVDTITLAVSNTTKVINKTLAAPVTTETTDRIRVNLLSIDSAAKMVNVVVTMKTIE